ncbi:MAG: Undecaprenyl-diphosphatase [Bacteroidota bacterium]|jgi:undecaprenyl-diphosphatase
MSTLQAIIIAIIEGLTEFLPISSTGHMALASALMGIGEDGFVKLFEVVIQLGAIAAVVVLYFKKFFDFKNINFYIKLAVAIIPTLVFGALLYKKIKDLIGNAYFVATILILGGVVLLFVDKWFKQSRISEEKDVTLATSAKIGLFQVLSMILPGLSRSGATIIGGMSMGLTKQLAAEFSFFLAVPTMLAASAKDLYECYKDTPQFLSGEYLSTLLLGSAIAFVVAIAAMKFFVSFVTKNGFKVFGIYRIIVGLIVLGMLLAGVKVSV